jgi:O-antigen/teichoic acid export membrane protein
MSDHSAKPRREILGRLPWKSAGVYTFANILSAVFPFLLLPIFTHFLAPSDYGTVATFQVLIGFVGPFVGLSLNGAIARSYFEREINFPEYIGNCLLLIALTTSLAGLVLWAGFGYFGSLLDLPREAYALALIVVLGQFTSVMVMTIWQVTDKAYRYGALKVAIAFASSSLSLWFVIGINLAWRGPILAQAVAYGLAGIVSFALLVATRSISFRVNPAYLKSAIAFGLPLIPHAFGGWLIMSADRIMLNQMVDKSATGIYSIAFQVTTAITMLQVSFNTAYVPWLYGKLKKNEPDDLRQIVRFTYLYAGGMILIACAFSWLAPLLFRAFAGKDYLEAVDFIYWLAPAKGLEAMYYMTCNYIFYSTKTKYIALATLGAATCHLGAAYLLIGHFGALGAAQATLVSSVLLVLLVWRFAAKLHKMPWFDSRLWAGAARTN